MNTKLLLWPAAALLGLSSLTAQAIPTLNQYAFNIDGVAPAPAGVNLTLFNTGTGLGTITASITGAGPHYFGAVFDHEFGANISNERGWETGNAAAGQSWEIDEAFLPSGDIYPNFLASALDNDDAVGQGDVAMGLGWDFEVGGTGTATITLLLDTVMPSSGFFLTHANGRDEQDAVYLSSTIDGAIIRQVPEPSMLLLLGIGLVGMVANRRREKV